MIRIPAISKASDLDLKSLAIQASKTSSRLGSAKCVWDVYHPFKKGQRCRKTVCNQEEVLRAKGVEKLYAIRKRSSNMTLFVLVGTPILKTNDFVASGLLWHTTLRPSNSRPFVCDGCVSAAQDLGQQQPWCPPKAWRYAKAWPCLVQQRQLQERSTRWNSPPSRSPASLLRSRVDIAADIPMVLIAASSIATRVSKNKE